MFVDQSNLAIDVWIWKLTAIERITNRQWNRHKWVWLFSIESECFEIIFSLLVFYHCADQRRYWIYLGINRHRQLLWLITNTREQSPAFKNARSLDRTTTNFAKLLAIDFSNRCCSGTTLTHGHDMQFEHSLRATWSYACLCVRQSLSTVKCSSFMRTPRRRDTTLRSSWAIMWWS